MVEANILNVNNLSCCSGICARLNDFLSHAKAARISFFFGRQSEKPFMDEFPSGVIIEVNI